VNAVTCSTLSSVPPTSQRREIQDSFDARAIARKVRTKQSATAATSSVSGDQKPPGPLNSGGGADASGGEHAALQEHMAFGIRNCRHGIVMWKFLHEIIDYLALPA
jgi:hypothetical protein